jgi:hypothetical protein
MRSIGLLIWLLVGRSLTKSTKAESREGAPEPARRTVAAQDGHLVVAQLLSFAGTVAIVFGPEFVKVNDEPGSEAFYTAAAQALPALLIGVVLAFRFIVREFQEAYAPIWPMRGPRWTATLHLSVWAMLLASGTCFTALTDCSNHHCGMASELDRVYLGLSAAYLLVARLVLASFQAMIRGWAGHGRS